MTDSHPLKHFFHLLDNNNNIIPIILFLLDSLTLVPLYSALRTLLCCGHGIAASVFLHATV
jgi:hypothetical protein